MIRAVLGGYWINSEGVSPQATILHSTQINFARGWEQFNNTHEPTPHVQSTSLCVNKKLVLPVL